MLSLSLLIAPSFSWPGLGVWSSARAVARLRVGRHVRGHRARARQEGRFPNALRACPKVVTVDDTRHVARGEDAGSADMRASRCDLLKEARLAPRDAC